MHVGTGWVTYLHWNTLHTLNRASSISWRPALCFAIWWYWSKIDHFWTNQGHCASCHKKWCLATSDNCQYGNRQTMFHIINSCPQTKLEGGLPQLHLAEDTVVQWLMSHVLQCTRKPQQHFASTFIAVSSSHLIAASSVEWSCSKPSSASFVSGQASTMWRVVCISLHGHLSDGARCHLWRFAAHCPCPVWKRFNVDHDRRGRSKPGCRIVGSVTNEWLTTDADSQTSLHHVAMLVGTISDQIGFNNNNNWNVLTPICFWELLMPF